MGMPIGQVLLADEGMLEYVMLTSPFGGGDDVASPTRAKDKLGSDDVSGADLAKRLDIPVWTRSFDDALPEHRELLMELD